MENYVEFDPCKAKQVHPAVRFQVGSSYKTDIEKYVPPMLRSRAVIAGGTFTMYTLNTEFAKRCPEVVQTLMEGHDTDIFIESADDEALVQLVEHLAQTYPDVQDLVPTGFNIKFVHEQSLINIIVMNKPIVSMIEDFLYVGSRIYYSYAADKIFCSKALFDTEHGNLESFLDDIANQNDEHIVKSQEAVLLYYYDGDLDHDDIRRIAAVYYLVKYIAKGFACPRWLELLRVILAKLGDELETPIDSFMNHAFGEKIRILRSIKNSILN